MLEAWRRALQEVLKNVGAAGHWADQSHPYWLGSGHVLAHPTGRRDGRPSLIQVPLSTPQTCVSLGDQAYPDGRRIPLCLPALYGPTRDPLGQCSPFPDFTRLSPSLACRDRGGQGIVSQLCCSPVWYEQKHTKADSPSQSTGQQRVTSGLEVRDVAPAHPAHVLSSTAMRGLRQSSTCTAAQDTPHCTLLLPSLSQPAEARSNFASQQVIESLSHPLWIQDLRICKSCNWTSKVEKKSFQWSIIVCSCVKGIMKTCGWKLLERRYSSYFLLLL